MKNVGIGVLRWLTGLIFGLAAAVLLFGLAARIATAAGATAVVGPLALLAGGFGIAFFPVVFAMGTRTPRQVARRGLVGLAAEGLIALLMVGYQVVAQSPLVPASALGWLNNAEQVARDMSTFFASDLLVAVLGLLIFALGLLLFVTLRPRATITTEPATSRAAAQRPSMEAPTTRAPAVGQSRTTSLPSGSPARATPPPTPAKTDDEDAQLMADLENLRKRLPKMGVDEPGQDGKT